MTLRAPEIEPPELPRTTPESGVIRDARRHRRRERVAAALLLLAAIVATLFLAGADGGAPPSRAETLRPHWMAGAPLSRPTHLRLLVSENGGAPTIVNVDSGQVHAVPGLGVPRKHRLWSPMLWPLTKVPGGALGIVHRRACNKCTGSETHYLITRAGAVRRISSFRLAPDQYSTTPVMRSASAIWVLTHPRHRHCTLRVEPGSGAATQVPCGTLLGDAAVGAGTGVLMSTSDRMILVDPHSGRVLARSPVNGQLDVLSRRTVLTGGPTGIQGQNEPAPPLTLINLTTGARRQLRWPSLLRFGYQVFPAPYSSLVAIEFADPAYDTSGRQAADVWLLDTHTGAFTHIPGFPIFEYLKFSGMAWATDNRLVIAAYGRRGPSIGIWRPGGRQLQVGALPRLSGYLQLVPFTG